MIEKPLISWTNSASCCEHGPTCVAEGVIGVKAILVRRPREVNETVELTYTGALRTSAQGTMVERMDALGWAGRLGRSQRRFCLGVSGAEEPSRLHGRVDEHSQRKADSREDWGQTRHRRILA